MVFDAAPARRARHHLTQRFPPLPERSLLPKIAAAARARLTVLPRRATSPLISARRTHSTCTSLNVASSRLLSHPLLAPLRGPPPRCTSSPDRSAAIGAALPPDRSAARPHRAPPRRTPSPDRSAARRRPAPSPDRSAAPPRDAPAASPSSFAADCPLPASPLPPRHVVRSFPSRERQASAAPRGPRAAACHSRRTSSQPLTATPPPRVRHLFVTILCWFGNSRPPARATG